MTVHNVLRQLTNIYCLAFAKYDLFIINIWLIWFTRFGFASKRSHNSSSILTAGIIKVYLLWAKDQKMANVRFYINRR